MTRLCERPGCSQPAQVKYGIDAARLTVWIEPLESSRPATPGVLCRRHADAMVVPMRWTLDDRREAVPRLFRPAAPTRRAAAADDADDMPRPPRQRSAAPVGTQLRLDAEVDEPSVAVASEATEAELADDGADPTTVLAWRPVFDERDDLDGLLHATSPLLSRAFRGEHRPREG